MNPSIIITGGTKGIGRAIANLFTDKNNWDVVICSRNKADLEQAKQELEAKGSRVFIHSTDMSQRKEVQALAQFILDKLEKIDVLVNNAGLFVPGDIGDEPEGNLELMMNTNLYSAYHLTRALLPRMVEQNSGHIFNICSVASLKAYPGGGSYSISKYALLGFSKGLREELKEKGIRVTSVMPGATWSNSWAGVELPEDRLMQANDVAQIIHAAYSLSDSAVVEDIVMRPQLGDL